MSTQEWLVLLAALNSAGLLPAAWALVRHVWRTERRLLTIELKMGIEHP